MSIEENIKKLFPFQYMHKLYGWKTVISFAAITFIFAGFFFFDVRWHRNIFYVFVPFMFFYCIENKSWHLFKNNTLNILVFSYLLYFWLTTFWTNGFELGDVFKSTKILLLNLLCFSVALSLFKRNRKMQDSVVTAIVVAASLSAIISTSLHIYNKDWSGPNYFSLRIMGLGSTDHPILGSLMFGVAIILLLYYKREYTKPLFGKPTILIMILPMLLYLLLSQSRGPILGLIITFISIGIIEKKSLIILVSTCFIIVPFLLFYIWDIQIGHMISRGFSHRIEFWQQAFHYISEKPFFGHGIATDIKFYTSHLKPLRSPHNAVLGTWVFGGLTGLFIFLGVIVSAAGKILPRVTEPESKVYLLLLIYSITVSQFDFRSFFVNLNPEWLVFWLNIILISAAYFTPQRKLA